MKRPRSTKRSNGSVLLIAVALLLMLGLIAVAFLSIAVHDRRSSSQYSLNTQADLLADGVVNMTQAAVGDDQPGVPRPLPGGTARGQNCAPLSHPFLASRVPVRLSEIAPPWETAVRFAGADHPRAFFQGEYVFSDGSYWVCRQTHTASAAAQPGSQSPYWLDSQTPGETPVWPAVSRPYPSHQSVDFAAAPAPPFSARCVMQPAWVQLAGKTFPAFQFYHPATDRMQTIIAADADGDGVADAPLVPLPVGKLNGLDYFYAVRVVDHGSAVNASVAWQPNEGTDPTTAGGLFPTNVDLRQLLRGGPEEMNRLNRLRFTTSAVDPSFDLQSARIDDARNARSDFEFLSPQEALWMQLGRRLGNPWFTGAQPSAGARPKFTALPASESDVLAYKGGAILNGELPPSQIEQALLESTCASPAGQPWAATLRKTPYSAGSSIAEWFANFDYLTEAPDDPSTWKPRRALLTTRNPVSDLAPGLDMSALAAAGEPPVATSSGEPGKMPFTRSPSVASVNTAPFGELWRAFWNVMGEDWSTSRTPFGDRYAFLIAQSSAGKFDDPYVGTRFAAATFAPDPEQHPARIFRSPLRAVRDGKIGFDASTPRLNPDQVLLLRAALASVNTLALRAHGEEVPWQDVHLSARVGGAKRPVTVRVYGGKKQPFFTEVYAQTDSVSSSPMDATVTNPNGYVAIEIHNPYPTPLDLLNCKLATINRTGTPDPQMPGDSVYPDLVLTDLSALAQDAVSLSAATSNLGDLDTPAIRPTVIPPGGFLVLENYDPRDPADPDRDPRAAGFRPAASGLPLTGLVPRGRIPNANFSFVKNLDRVLNKELILLRPTGAVSVHERIHNINYDGSAAPAVVRYDGGAQAIDMVPLDAFDFTGLRHPAADEHACSAWHYARASHTPSIPGDVDKAWHFVYPGRYDGSQSPTAPGSDPPRLQGTQAVTWDPGASDDPWVAVPLSPGISLGTDGGSIASGINFDATYPTEFPIRVADLNWAGPSAPLGPTGNRYPFGGFARRTDLLEIPYIGAYRVQLADQVSTNHVLELNPITLDSVFAEDTDTSDDAPATPEDREFIGRFAPTASDLGAAAEGEAASVTANALIDSHRTEPADMWAGYDVLITGGAGRPQVRSVVASDPTTGTLQLAPIPAGNPALPPGSRYALHANRYAWAARLFDYLDVLAPRGDYLPNANPADYGYPNPADGKFRPILPAPVSVQHTRSTIAPALAIEGRININTAPWRVLATVPFFDSNADRMDFRLETPDPMARGLPTLQPNNLPDNEELARAIVSWRQAHGPFRSLFDLYRVPAFVQANRLAVQLSGRAIPNDFQQRFFLLARVGNVLTTRSDSFTCYVLVQGWRGVGTASPELVVQRRRTFMVDRSGAAAVPPDLAVRSFYNP